MAEATHPGNPGTGPTLGHEASDLKPRAIALSLLVLAAMIVGVLLVSMWIHDYAASRLARQESPPSPAAKQAGPPELRLQVAAPRDLRGFLAQEDAILGSYGWVKRETGVVRIPIDRAIEVLTQRGLPAAGGTGQPVKEKRK